MDIKDFSPEIQLQFLIRIYSEIGYAVPELQDLLKHKPQLLHHDRPCPIPLFRGLMARPEDLKAGSVIPQWNGGSTHWTPSRDKADDFSYEAYDRVWADLVDKPHHRPYGVEQYTDPDIFLVPVTLELARVKNYLDVGLILDQAARSERFRQFLEAHDLESHFLDPLEGLAEEQEYAIFDKDFLISSCKEDSLGGVFRAQVSAIPHDEARVPDFVRQWIHPNLTLEDFLN